MENKYNNAYVQKKFAQGDRVEELLCQHYESQGWKVERAPKQKFSDWDIKVSHSGFTHTLEVKYNSGIEQYGHCFVEVYQSGQPSGLTVSKASHQVHVSETGEVKFMRTEDLKGYIDHFKPRLIDNKYRSYNGTKVAGSGYKIPWNTMSSTDINLSL